MSKSMWKRVDIENISDLEMDELIKDLANSILDTDNGEQED